MYGSEPKLEVPRTGVMISSDVLPDNGQLEPCSENLPDNGFSHSETDPDTPSLPPGLRRLIIMIFVTLILMKIKACPQLLA